MTTRRNDPDWEDVIDAALGGFFVESEDEDDEWEEDDEDEDDEWEEDDEDEDDEWEEDDEDEDDEWEEDDEDEDDEWEEDDEDEDDEWEEDDEDADDEDEYEESEYYEVTYYSSAPTADTLSPRRRFSYEERTSIADSQEWLCAYCSCQLDMEILEIDHRLPISRGGTNSRSNLQALCRRCNSWKGSKSHEEFMARFGDLLNNAD